MLTEFGLITFISIDDLPDLHHYHAGHFQLSPKPRKSDTNHLNNKLFHGIINKLVSWTFGHGRSVIAASIILVLVALPGVLMLRSAGYILDDVSHRTRLYHQDQQFFESEFNGILPLRSSSKKTGTYPNPRYHRESGLSS